MPNPKAIPVPTRPLSAGEVAQQRRLIAYTKAREAKLSLDSRPRRSYLYTAITPPRGNYGELMSAPDNEGV